MSTGEPDIERNRQVVLRFIEAMGSGDAAAAEACLAADAFTVAKGYTRFAGRRDREVMVGTIEAFNAIVPTGLRPAILSVTAEGDRVTVEWEGDAVTSAGTPYRNQYCMVFFLTGGLIRQVNEYFCTIHADTVLWPLVEAAMGQASG